MGPQAAWLVAAVIALPMTGAAETQKPSWPGCPRTPDRYYPEHAQRHNIEGEVVLNCMVFNDHRIKDCIVVSETPQGEDFGPAAQRIVECWMKAETPGRRDIPFKFRLPH